MNGYMADQSEAAAERVSALVDGQLLGDEFVQVLADLESSGAARAQWDMYHVVGDVLRSSQVNAAVHDADFVQRLRQRLSEDGAEIVAVAARPISAGEPKYLKSESANNSSWRRLAGVASVALMAVLAWQGLQWVNSSDPAAAPQLAQQHVTTPAQAASAFGMPQPDALASGPALIQADGSSALAMTADSQIMIRDPQLDALLAAHRQFGGTSALQMPAGFLRNATFAEGRR